MVNPQKGRGTRWESAVRDALMDAGLPARREVQRGAADVGDLSIEGLPFSIEAKDHKSIDLAAFVDQANRQAANAGQPYGVAIVKRRRKSVTDAYVVLDLATFIRILNDHFGDQ